jgi:hypothetical protein
MIDLMLNDPGVKATRLPFNNGAIRAIVLKKSGLVPSRGYC